MKDTKQKLLSYTESIEIHKAKYKTDLEKVIASYRKNIETQEYFLIPLLILKKNALSIKINVEEGNKYYFGDIKF
jgi:outer membrane protein insertion porin family